MYNIYIYIIIIIYIYIIDIIYYIYYILYLIYPICYMICIKIMQHLRPTRLYIFRAGVSAAFVEHLDCSCAS